VGRASARRQRLSSGSAAGSKVECDVEFECRIENGGRVLHSAFALDVRILHLVNPVINLILLFDDDFIAPDRVAL
jgi:hypothetical protein